MIDGKRPQSFFPKREVGKFYIIDIESGWPIECTEEQWEQHKEILKALMPKLLDGYKSNIIITGTAGGLEGQSILYERMFYNMDSKYTISIDPYKSNPLGTVGMFMPPYNKSCTKTHAMMSNKQLLLPEKAQALNELRCKVTYIKTCDGVELAYRSWSTKAQDFEYEELMKMWREENMKFWADALWGDYKI